MKHPSAGLLPLVLLTLLAALTFWLERATRIGNGQPSNERRHVPDFIVNHFTVRRFDDQGALQYVLTAQKMLHYGDDNSTDVVAPALSYRGRAYPLRISARYAWLSKDGKEVRLYNDVRMVRGATADNPQLVVTTSEMNVYPDQQIARSKMPVTIKQGRDVVTGVGFEADNRTHIYKLLAEVHGIFYQNKN